MGRFLEAGLPRVRLVRFCRPPGSRCLVGPAACGPYRQAIVGAGLRLTGVTSRMKWQQCRAGREIFVWYGALWPRSALDLVVAGRAVATPRLIVFMWV